MTSHQDISTSNENNGVLAARVFAIPELLEAILILLQPQDILISQRVARTWKHTIDGSKRIRQALFIEPEPAQTAWLTMNIPDGELIAESNTFKVGKYTVAQVPASSIPQGREDGNPYIWPIISIKAHLNTMLHMRGHWKQMTLDDRIERGEGLRLGRTKKKILGYGRQMFLTQPPCKEVLVWIDWGQPKRVYNEGGVRFWQVLEITEGATMTAYLPHMFMLAKGVIALTDAEEEMVREELGKKGEKGDGIPLVGARDGPQYTWEVVQTSGTSQIPGGRAVEAVRQWLGW